MKDKKNSLFLLYLCHAKMQQKLSLLKGLKLKVKDCQLLRNLMLTECIDIFKKKLIFKEDINFHEFADPLKFRKSYLALPLKKVPLELTFLYLTGGASLKENLSFTEMGYKKYDLQKWLKQHLLEPNFSSLSLSLQNYSNIEEGFKHMSLNTLTIENFFGDNDFLKNENKTKRRENRRCFFNIKKIINFPGRLVIAKRMRTMRKFTQRRLIHKYVQKRKKHLSLMKEILEVLKDLKKKKIETFKTKQKNFIEFNFFVLNYILYRENNFLVFIIIFVDCIIVRDKKIYKLYISWNIKYFCDNFCTCPIS